MKNKKYTVCVDDNYNYMDESARYLAGSFQSLDEAIEMCKLVIVKDLDHLYEKGMTPDELRAQWLQFGDDPFIRGAEKSIPFSARNFLRTELGEALLTALCNAGRK